MNGDYEGVDELLRYKGNANSDLETQAKLIEMAAKLGVAIQTISDVLQDVGSPVYAKLVKVHDELVGVRLRMYREAGVPR